MIWTAKKDALLMKMWRQGIKTKEIGNKLGTTKGSVIGRHRRLVERQAACPIHPAFDPKAKVWFVTKPKVEAGSIQELLKKLPEGSIIKDYRKIA